MKHWANCKFHISTWWLRENNLFLEHVGSYHVKTVNLRPLAGYELWRLSVANGGVFKRPLDINCRRNFGTVICKLENLGITFHPKIAYCYWSVWYFQSCKAMKLTHYQLTISKLCMYFRIHSNKTDLHEQNATFVTTLYCMYSIFPIIRGWVF